MLFSPVIKYLPKDAVDDAARLPMMTNLGIHSPLEDFWVILSGKTGDGKETPKIVIVSKDMKHFG